MFNRLTPFSFFTRSRQRPGPGTASDPPRFHLALIMFTRTTMEITVLVTIKPRLVYFRHQLCHETTNVDNISHTDLASHPQSSGVVHSIWIITTDKWRQAKFLLFNFLLSNLWTIKYSGINHMHFKHRLCFVSARKNWMSARLARSQRHGSSRSGIEPGMYVVIANSPSLKPLESPAC